MSFITFHNEWHKCNIYSFVQPTKAKLFLFLYLFYRNKLKIVYGIIYMTENKHYDYKRRVCYIVIKHVYRKYSSYCLCKYVAILNNSCWLLIICTNSVIEQVRHISFFIKHIKGKKKYLLYVYYRLSNEAKNE